MRQLAHTNPLVRVSDVKGEDVGIETLLAAFGSRCFREVAATSYDKFISRHASKGCSHTLHAIAHHQLGQVVNTKSIELTVFVLKLLN